MCNIHLTSTKMCADLEKNYGIVPQKTFILEHPKTLTKEQEYAYIIGYIDGDGYISYRPRAKFAHIKYFKLGILGRYDMCVWFREKFQNILGESYIIPNNITKDDNIYRFGISGKYPVNTILKYLADYNVPKMGRKWNKV